MTIGFGLIVLGLMVIPLDGLVNGAVGGVKFGGDVRRELELLQQFGAPASVAIGFVLALCLDPKRARRFLDWALAAGVVSLVILGLKIVFGRARPRFDDSLAFNWVWGRYPAGDAGADGVRRDIGSWMVGEGGVEGLWSMPSSHTSAAVVFAVFLLVVWPRLRWFAVGMGVLVASCRVVFGAHWLSDVCVGAGVAVLIAVPMVRAGSGVRFLDWLWVKFVDRGAEPAWPGLPDG